MWSTASGDDCPDVAALNSPDSPSVTFTDNTLIAGDAYTLVTESLGPPVHRCAELSADGNHQVGIRPAVVIPDGKRAGEHGAGDGVADFGMREWLRSNTVPVFRR